MTGTGKPADSGRPQAAPTEPEGSGPIRIPAPVRETPSPPSVTAGRPDVRPLQQEDAPDSPAGAAPAQSAAPDGGSVPAPEPVPEPEPWRMAGEVLNTYIVVEQGDKVLFIDKHAAHERLNFDRLKAEGAGGGGGGPAGPAAPAGAVRL